MSDTAKTLFQRSDVEFLIFSVNAKVASKIRLSLLTQKTECGRFWIRLEEKDWPRSESRTSYDINLTFRVTKICIWAVKICTVSCSYEKISNHSLSVVRNQIIVDPRLMALYTFRPRIFRIYPYSENVSFWAASCLLFPLYTVMTIWTVTLVFLAKRKDWNTLRAQSNILPE